MSKKWISRIALLVLGAVLMYVIGMAWLNMRVPDTGVEHLVGHVGAVESPQFEREAAALLGSQVISGNTVQDYQNGANFFPPMLADIRSAQVSINLESYIFRDSHIGMRFAKALAERARAGVKVHVLVDWIGSFDSDKVARRLRAAGVKFRYFRPLRWRTLDRLNNRSHRKLMIVDGRIGWTGGFGIDDIWTGHADSGDVKRDMMFRIRGPVVARMQGLFGNDWTTATGNLLAGADYYPSLHEQGHVTVQLQASAPRGGRRNVELMFLLAIRGARSSIDLESAYFVPDPLMRTALLDALSRGVRVRIIVPGHFLDSGITLHASQATWGDYLAAGAKIYRFQPSMLHSKLMIVDDYLVIGGSSNFDYRSFNLNDEADVMIYNRHFARHMDAVYNHDIAQSRRVSLSEWQDRSWTHKFVDDFWWLFSPQL
ncbi:MAG TPA: phospholipase D-like domain-containing protein [Oleiagrimonas sp.]|nr:phospholipase D-like domain-containing protein [Oleiagrimonas sp.]